MKNINDDQLNKVAVACAAIGNSEGMNLPIDKDNPADPRNLVNFFELILNNVYSGIIVCDTDAKIVFMNAVYADLIGINRSDAIGCEINKFFPYSRLREVMKTGRAELGQKCRLKTDTPLLVNRIPLRYEGKTTGVILQTVFRDYKHFTDLLARLNLLEKEVKYFKEGLDTVLSARYNFQSIIGQSKAIREAKDLTRHYAKSEAPVLVTGPTGAGKELFSHAVHSESARRGGPFVSVNCAAIPRELLESELFGYESGAFTGASKKGKPGQIELAHEGTFYLDEIGDLPLPAQAKLLRILDTKMLDKLGSVKSKHVDFRLVAATNKDLADMIKRRRFRDDLFYRLNTMTVKIPPLAERKEDIPLLVDHFLETLDKRNLSVTDEAMADLMGYSWPGNIRELKNIVERAVSLVDKDVITQDQLPQEMLKNCDEPVIVSESSNTLLADEIARFEAAVLQKRLAANNGNMAKTAKSLGISRSTFYEKCKRLNLL